MRKNAAIVMVLALTLLVTFATVTPARAADYTRVGVKGGQWAKYSLAETGYSHGMTMLVNVVNVTAPKLFLNMTYYNADGAYNTTFGKQVWQVSVLDGSGMFLLFFVCAAGLVKGDAIYSGSSLKFNDSVSQSAAGASRTCNDIVITGGGNTLRWYMDQSTGILVAMTFVVGAFSLNMTMTSTNIWMQDIILYGAIGGAALIIIILAVLLLRRRK